MDRTNMGGDSYRPPPTSPKGHVKKKARREGPFRPHDDTKQQPSAHASGQFQHDDDERDFKPHQLGGYVLQDRPTAPEFKIRGRSGSHPMKAENCDLDDVPSLTELQRVFLGAISGSFEHIQEFENFLGDFGCPLNHPASRTIPRFKGQLNRLKEVYRAMNGEIDGLINELDQLAAREEELKRELDDSRTARFKLECANRDLAGEARDLRSAITKANGEVGRLQHEARELTTSQKHLDSRYRELVEWRTNQKTERMQLEGTLRNRNAEIKRSVAEVHRLQYMVEERDKHVKGLQSDKLALKKLVRERETETEEVRADNSKLQFLIREKDTKISALIAAPVTPLTPLAELAPFAFTAAPGRAQSQPQPQPQPLQVQPPRPASPLPYIKQEAPDQATATGALEAVPHLPSAVSLQSQTEQVHQLGTGAANVLSRLLLLEPSVVHNEVLSTFLMRLGASPEAPPANSTSTRTRYFWFSEDAWLPEPTSPAELHPSLEARFAHLCLLFPFQTSQPPSVDADEPQTFHLLSSLLSSLIKEAHSTSRRAGRAFLETMSALPRATPSETPSSAKPTPRIILLHILLSELCRVLRTAIPEASLLCNGIANGSLIENIGTDHDDSPLGRFARVIAEGDCSPEKLKQGLLEACGSAFCLFGVGFSVACGSDNTDGIIRGTRDVGLLRCGGEHSDFLMFEFGDWSFRFVDGRLAGMMPNATEPKKFDLVIARGSAKRGSKEEEELFRLAAAPKDVAAFWLQVCYG